MRIMAHHWMLTLLIALAANSSSAEPTPIGYDLETRDSTESQEEPRLILTVRSPLSPYERVQYEIKVRSRTPIATLTKTLAGGYGDLQGLALMTQDDMDGVVAEIERCNFMRLVEEAVRNPAVESGLGYWQLDLRLEGAEIRVTRDIHQLTPDTRFWCVAEAIIVNYLEFGTPVPFRNLFFDSGEYGELYTDSVPQARVFINGRDTEMETPIHKLPLLPGVHDIRYVNQELGIDRLYDVTIMEGYTTRLVVDLR